MIDPRHYELMIVDGLCRDLDTLVIWAPLDTLFTVALCFDRPAKSRRFAALVLVAATVQLTLWGIHTSHFWGIQSEIFFATWPGALLLWSLWRLLHRPRELYVPPPDPPPFGGPYR